MFDWLQYLADQLVYRLLGLDAESHLGQALNFFFYDVVKVLILLLGISLLMGVVHLFFPIGRIRDFLRRRKLYGAEFLMASLLGAVTPFCSCSSVPLFVGFVRGGIPLGITLSFLITSPLVNEVALALFLSSFGWKVTLIYGGSGVIVGTLGGMVLSRFRLEGWLEPWVQQLKIQPPGEADTPSEPLADRLRGVWAEALAVVKKVWLYVVIGIGIGAAMHGYVPDDFFAQYLSADRWWTVPLAVVLAVPLYANAAAIVPVIQVFVQKGMALGTALAFMMSTVGLSTPEGILLKKVMSLRLILLYFGVVAFMIILLGFFFNWLL